MAIVTQLGTVNLMQININPVPRTYIRGIEAFPLQGSQNIHPRAHARGVLWYGVNAIARIFSVLSVSALLLSGCIKVGPDFKKPAAQVEDKWLEVGDPKIRSESGDYANWWTVFNDPVLNSLIESAYRQNLPLRIAGIRILNARAQLGIAVGSQYPQQQDAFGVYSREQLSRNNANPARSKSFDFWSPGFDALWELDIWGRFRRGVESADADLAASIANYDDILVSLVAEVASVYIQIRTLEQRLEVARENVRIQGRSLQIAQARFRGGAVTELDVTQATALLRNTESTIPSLETNLRQARNALSILLGTPPRDLGDILGAPGRIPTAPPEIAVGIPAELLRRRPDIRRAELQAAAQSAQIGIARADLFPAFSLVGNIAFEAEDAGNIFEGNSLAGSIGPSIQWPILNYGRLKDNVRVRDARFQELIVSYQDTVLRAQLEVEDAIVAFLRSQDQVRFLFESVEAAKRSVDLALIQYREGIADYQRVLDTQGFLVQQQDNLTAGNGDVPRNLIALYKALGGGWEIRRGKDFVPPETRDEMRSRTDWGKLLSPDEIESPPSWEPDW